MATTEDLFTPVHKGLRSMIYDLGRRLQSTDFSDRAASAAVLDDLQHEFDRSVSAACILCLLHSHAGHEEIAIFPAMQPIDPALIRQLIDGHQEISRRLGIIARLADELGTLEASEPRAELGDRINRAANDLFAYYLAHLNHEEATLVPAMKAHFTDEQMRAMQGRILRGMPPDQVVQFLRWMLPSLSIPELDRLVGSLAAGAPPELVDLVRRIGAAYVEPVRWTAVQRRIGWASPGA